MNCRVVIHLSEPSIARWMSTPTRMSSNGSIEFAAAGESVPSPTRSPAWRNLSTGAAPIASFALHRGQYAMATSCRGEHLDVRVVDLGAVHRKHVGTSNSPHWST